MICTNVKKKRFDFEEKKEKKFSQKKCEKFDFELISRKNYFYSLGWLSINEMIEGTFS